MNKSVEVVAKKRNRTIIICTRSYKIEGIHEEVYTLGFDDDDGSVVGEIQELSFDELCEIDEFLHDFVTKHRKSGGPDK